MVALNRAPLRPDRTGLSTRPSTADDAVGGALPAVLARGLTFGALSARAAERRRRHLGVALAALALAASPAEAVKRRAFVTSVSGNGNLASWPGSSGLSALERGDSICRARAAAGGLPNASGFRVWLSTSATDAYCHVQGLSGFKSNGCDGVAEVGGGPWYLANGISNFTGTLAALSGPEGTIYRPILLDENLGVLPATPEQRPYWTGSTRTGESATETCGDWMSSSATESGLSGDKYAAGPTWTDAAPRPCDESHRLLCFEPGESEPTEPHWSPAAIVFLNSAEGTGDLGSWPEAGGAQGIEAGDRICRHLAAVANLPSPAAFVAWLSTSLTDARDRLAGSGPFVRVDGYSVAVNVVDLTDGSTSNSLHVHEVGSYLTAGGPEVWTGTASAGVAVVGGTCGDWSAGDDSVSGTAGSAAYARLAAWTDTGSIACSRKHRLYCISNLITLFWDGFESGTTARW